MTPPSPSPEAMEAAVRLRTEPCRGGDGHAVTAEVAAIDGVMLPSKRHCSACLALALDSFAQTAREQERAKMQRFYRGQMDAKEIAALVEESK